MQYMVRTVPVFQPLSSSLIQVKTRATFFNCLRMSVTKNLRRVVLEFHRTGTKKWSTIDSISQNEESKIAFDYAMILHNNKFTHGVLFQRDRLFEA